MRSRNAIALALFLAVLVGAAGIYAAYQRDISTIRAQVLGGSQVADTAAGKIEYAVAGTGTALFSIHGAGGGYDQGLLIISDLAGEGYKVIAPSRFGYLRTPVPGDVSPAAQADAHAALLDSLGIDKAIVVGTSAGGPSAIQLALRHPKRVSALILLAPLGFAPAGPAPMPMDPLVLNVVQSGGDFMYWSMLRASPSALYRLAGVTPEVVEQAGPDAKHFVGRVLGTMLPLSMRIRGLAVDAAVPLEPWPLEQISAPTLIVYPSGGHMFVGHAADVREAVAGFLAQATANSASAGGPGSTVQ